MNKQEKMIKGTQLSWITVSDIKKAKNFFADILGLDILESNEECGWLEIGGEEGARIGIGQANPQCGDFTPGQNAIITLSVDNLDEVMEKLKAKGVNFVGEVQVVPEVVKMALFLDLDGNKFQLVEDLSSR